MGGLPVHRARAGRPSRGAARGRPRPGGDRAARGGHRRAGRAGAIPGLAHDPHRRRRPVPRRRMPIGLSCRIYRPADGRPSPTPDPQRLREALARRWPRDRDRPRLRAARHRRPRAPAVGAGRHRAGGGRVHLQPLPLRAGLARAAGRRRRRLRARGVRTLFINSNDAERYPADSLEAMRARVAAERGWTVPYLHDEAQEVARALGARTTPDVFVVDGEMRRPLPGRAGRGLRRPGGQRAVAARGARRRAVRRRAETAGDEPVGCSIKWKP